MKGFIVYPTYRIVDDKAKVYLFGRLENGESFLSIHDFKPYFYIKKTDLPKAIELDNFTIEEIGFKDFHENEVVKVIFNTPRQVPEARKKFENADIVCYEADIRFVMRFLMDNGILASLKFEGEFKKGNIVNRIYENPKITPAEYFPKLKVLSLDIETDMKADKLFSVSMVCDGYEKVIMHTDKKLKQVISVDSEKKIIETFREKVRELDPDIITGWNVIDFDLKILRDKFKMYKIPFDLGRTEWEGTLRIESSFFKDSQADLPGRMVLDGIHLMKSSFIRLDDYKLGTAAKEFLGEEKMIGDGSKGEDIENAFRNDPQFLADYNLKESQMVIDIIEKTKVVDLTITRSMLTGMPLDRVKSSIASLDSLYLRELKKRGYVANSVKREEDETRITGGFVQESKPGIYDYILVLDFKSLYPSLMRTFNIDPLSFVEDCKGKDLIVAPNGACFRNEDGILPIILEHLWKQREKAKKRKRSVKKPGY